MGYDLKGRWFNVALCADCWDRANPDRQTSVEQRAEMEADAEKAIAAAVDEGQDAKDFVSDNRCPCCDERLHVGIYIRVTSVTLRELRHRLGY